MPTRNFVTLFLALLIGLICYQTAQRNRYATTIGSAMALVEQRALEPRERRELFYAAMDGMMQSLDEHSAFLDPERLPQLNEHLDQEFGGVGIVVERDPTTRELRVLTPLVGSPAQKAGVAAGDVILAIDDQSVDGMDVDATLKAIRGPRGSNVKLRLRDEVDAAEREVVLVRELIAVESALGDTRRDDGSWDFRLEEDRRIAYVRLTEFGEKTVAELDQVAASWKEPPSALILDLRDNTGGLLDAAVAVCDRFIDSGTIVTIKRRGGELDRPPYVATAGTVFPTTIPMAVLINGNTASAAEIVAACLQDHGRAVVVGERSFGKGTVQQIIRIDGGRSALKLTVSSYWRPSGLNIHRLRDGSSSEWGVMPNDGYLVPLTDAERRVVLLARRKRDYPATRLDATTLANMLDPMGRDESPAAEDAAPAGEDETPEGISSVPADTAPTLEGVELQGGQDPQLKRAIEAVREKMSPAVAGA